MKKSLFIVLAIALMACTPVDTQEETAPAQPAPTQEEAPEPEPAPAPANDTGDYSSVNDYTNEVLDTTDKIMNTNDIMIDAVDDLVVGAISPDGFATLATEAQTVVRSHRTFFENREAPEQFRRMNGYLVAGLSDFEESYGLMADCSRTLDASYCERATALMIEGSEEIARGTAEIESMN